MTGVQTCALPISPDSYAHGVVARQYNADGSLRSQTEATTLRRFEAQGRVELLAPRRRQFDGDDEWFASADRGLLQERRDLLRLSGTARLRYLTGAAQFDTEELLIDLRNKIARSLTPVLLVQEDGHRLRAQRLVADLERRRAVFTGDVASVYVPARR